MTQAPIDDRGPAATCGGGPGPGSKLAVAPVIHCDSSDTAGTPAPGLCRTPPAGAGGAGPGSNHEAGCGTETPGMLSMAMTSVNSTLVSPFAAIGRLSMGSRAE